jgi:hypothetical protein
MLWTVLLDTFLALSLMRQKHLKGTNDSPASNQPVWQATCKPHASSNMQHILVLPVSFFLCSKKLGCCYGTTVSVERMAVQRSWVLAS